MLSERVFIAFPVLVEDVAVLVDAQCRYRQGSDSHRSCACGIGVIQLRFPRETVECRILLDVGGEQDLSVRKYSPEGLMSRMECQSLGRSAFAGRDKDVLALFPV